MKALIEIATSKILIFSGEVKEFGGPWGQGLSDGKLKFVDIPPGERLEELILVGEVVQVDAAKKAERVAKEVDFDTKTAKLTNLKKADLQTAGVPDLDKMCDAILDIAKVARRLAKGD